MLSPRQKMLLEYIRARGVVNDAELRKFYTSKEYLKVTLERLWSLGLIKPNYGTWVYTGEVRGQRLLNDELETHKDA